MGASELPKKTASFTSCQMPRPYWGRYFFWILRHGYRVCYELNRLGTASLVPTEIQKPSGHVAPSLRSGHYSLALGFLNFRRYLGHSS